MQILGLIPARGGSKGIPNKNITKLHGSPLISYTIQAALNCPQLNNLIVSTDSQYIADIAVAEGADVPFLRPTEFSGDRSGAVEVIQHAIDHFAEQGKHFDLIVYLQPTSPLRNSEDIQSALAIMMKSNADALVSVMDVPHQFGLESLMTESADTTPLVSPAVEAKALQRRQEKPQYVARNGPAIVITRPETIEQFGTLYGDKTASYKMPNKRSVDVDSIDDLEYIDWLMQKQQR